MERVIAREDRYDSKTNKVGQYITKGKIYDVLPNEGAGKRFIDEDGHILGLEHYGDCFEPYDGDESSNSIVKTCKKCGHYKFELSGEARTVYKGVILGGEHEDVIQYDSVERPQQKDLDYIIILCAKCNKEV